MRFTRPSILKGPLFHREAGAVKQALWSPRGKWHRACGPRTAEGGCPYIGCP